MHERTHPDGGAVFALISAYYLIEYWRPQEVVPALQLLQPGLLVTGALVLYLLKNFQAGLFKDPAITRAMMFFALVGVSVTYAVNQFWVFQTFKGLILMALGGVAPLLIWISTAQRLDRFMQMFLLVNGGVAIYAITHAGKGPGGFLGDENDLALCMTMAVPYAYFFARRSDLSIRRRLVFLMVLLLLLLAVVASSSRGGFVGLVAATLGVLYVSRRRLRKALLLMLVCAGAVGFLPDQYVGEIKSIDNSEDSTRQDRLWSWKMAWHMFEDHPVLGVGAFNYRWRVEEYERNSPEFDPVTMRLHGGRASHSMYFDLISELGLAGATVFGLLLWTLWTRLRAAALALRLHAETGVPQSVSATLKAMPAALMAYLACGLFISVLYYPHLWYFSAIAVVALRLLPDAQRAGKTQAQASPDGVGVWA